MKLKASRESQKAQLQTDLRLNNLRTNESPFSDRYCVVPHSVASFFCRKKMTFQPSDRGCTAIGLGKSFILYGRA